MAKMTTKELSTQELRDNLLINRKTTDSLSDTEVAADKYCEGYRDFLNRAKTERETVAQAIESAKANGFVPFNRSSKLKAGDKVYYNNRGKALILAIIGSKPITDGLSIVAAHIDSPRLDLKPNPLYEEHELAYFDTHYYGGIKKYQWTAIPLALHGVVVRKDGTVIPVRIGEDEQDPIFCVTDLLPHLAAAQLQRTGTEVVKGEDLDILVGSRRLNGGEGSELVKLNIMKILNSKYGIVESDFISAELEVVPAFGARDLGLDRSMIGAYGHDDRVCSYPALTALFSAEHPLYTALTVLADKEEVGSEGNTGMQSYFFRDFVADIAAAFGEAARHVFPNSICLSADVIGALDPIYADVADTHNVAVLNRGVVLTKYRGFRGKAETSDASAEMLAYLRQLLDEENVLWQTGESGRVDAGGGKTVAKFIANLNIDTVDLGVPLLSMHAPLEVASKLDVYSAHKAFTAFFNRNNY